MLKRQVSVKLCQLQIKNKRKAYNLKQNMENFKTTFIVTVP